MTRKAEDAIIAAELWDEEPDLELVPIEGDPDFPLDDDEPEAA